MKSATEAQRGGGHLLWVLGGAEDDGLHEVRDVEMEEELCHEGRDDLSSSY